MFGALKKEKTDPLKLFKIIVDTKYTNRWIIIEIRGGEYDLPTT